MKIIYNKKKVYIQPLIQLKPTRLELKLLGGSNYDIHGDDFGPEQERANFRSEFSFQSANDSKYNIDWDF